MNVRFDEIVVGTEVFTGVAFEDITVEDFLQLVSDGRVKGMRNLVVADNSEPKAEPAAPKAQRGSRNRPVVFYDLQTKETRSFLAIVDMARYLGVGYSDISRCLKNGRLLKDRYQIDYKENCRQAK